MIPAMSILPPSGTATNGIVNQLGCNNLVAVTGHNGIMATSAAPVLSVTSGSLSLDALKQAAPTVFQEDAMTGPMTGPPNPLNM
jgi:hypothetical protein